VDFKTLEPGQIRYQLVHVNLAENFGRFLTQYTVSQTNNHRTISYVYYFIWTGNDYSTDYRYMTIKVPASYVKEMDNMAEGSAEPIFFYGKIRKLQSDYLDSFNDFFLQQGFTEEEIAEYTLPYYIDSYNSTWSMVGASCMYVLVFVGGVVLVVIAILWVVKANNGGYLAKLRNDIAAAGYTESTIEADYAAALYINKNGDTRLGTLMTYYTSGLETRAIPNNKIIWAYQNTITHRTNGIKTGTTYNVTLYVEGVKNAYTLSVPDETAAAKMLDKIYNTFPWVVVGYTEDLKKRFNNARGEFLQLRYNTCEHIALEPRPEGGSVTLK